MSVKLIAAVFERSRSTMGSRLTLLAIADFADDLGRAWPSVETLAKKTRQSVRNVQYSITKLKRLGELEVRPNAGWHGSNMYLIRFPKAIKGVQTLHPPLQNSTGTPARIAPEPSLEPSINTSTTRLLENAIKELAEQKVMSR